MTVELRVASCVRLRSGLAESAVAGVLHGPRRLPDGADWRHLKWISLVLIGTAITSSASYGFTYQPERRFSFLPLREQMRNRLCKICATSCRVFGLRSAPSRKKLHRKFPCLLRFSAPSDIRRGGPPLPNEGLLSGRIDTMTTHREAGTCVRQIPIFPPVPARSVPAGRSRR